MAADASNRISTAAAAGVTRPTLVHVVRDPGVSGSARVALEILGDPALAGCRRVVICGCGTGVYGPFIQELGRLGIEWMQVEHLHRDVGTHDVRALIELIRIIRRLKPDLVHTHSAKPFMLAGLAAWILRVPRRIHTLHGISFHKFTPVLPRAFYYLLEQFSSLLYNRIVSVNRYYVRYFPLARARRALEVIPNGIALPREITHDPIVPGREFPILFAGRLDDQKDPLFVLDVAESIERYWRSDQVPRFYVAGSGPLTERLAGAISARRLQEKVVALGWVSDLARHYAGAKVLFLPSRWEACGLVLIEAAAYGCPAVASNVEGVPEVIRHGQNGLLFEQGDVAAACKCLAQLAQEETFRRELGDRARREAQGRDVGAMLGRYVGLYRSLGLAL